MRRRSPPELAQELSRVWLAFCTVKNTFAREGIVGKTIMSGIAIVKFA